jgi:predicted PurR-regulated permease PerM
MLIADYPFLSFFWDVLLLFAWLTWFWLAITVFSDLFRRRDISGWMKTVWVILVIVLPFIGVFVYLIAEHGGMAERNVKQVQQSQQEFDSYVKSVASRTDPSEQIASAKQLLDTGTISTDEFDRLKAKALA